MSQNTITAQTLLCQLQILSACLEIEAMSYLELSTEPWKKYTAEDYDTPEDYCRACLVDLNDRQHYYRDANLCSLPVIAPRKSKVVYLEALRLAEKFLINPKNEYALDGDRTERIQVAGSLVKLLKSFDQTPDPVLVELSESE